MIADCELFLKSEKALNCGCKILTANIKTVMSITAKSI
jgi:hypothetical protein